MDDYSEEKSAGPNRWANSGTTNAVGPEMEVIGEPTKQLKRRRGSYQRTVGKRSKLQIRDNVEDSYSEEDDYLPLATTRQAIETTNEGNPGADVEG